MKITPRMQKALLQWFFLNISICSIFIIWVFSIVYPKYIAIEEKKQEYQNTLLEIEKTKKTWIWFWDFKKQISKDENIDAYTQTVIKNISSDFYSRSISNTKNKDFSENIEKIREKIVSFKESESYKKRESSLQRILPVYSPANKEGLRERDFINYVEKLLYSFNLSYQWEIGIWDISEYTTDKKGAKKSWTKTQSDLQHSIYYIPLHFDIVGQKGDVFDFLHYFENVGAVKLEADELSVYRDAKINTVISGERYSTSYNIYEGQISDIIEFEAKKYPDSSNFSRSDSGDLLDIVSSEQSREKYEISLSIRFFVSGEPSYRMTTLIDGVIQDFSTLKASVLKDNTKYRSLVDVMNTGEEVQAYRTLQSLADGLMSLSESFSDFQKEYRQRKDINASYVQAVTLKKNLNFLDAKYKKALDVLTWLQK